MRSEDRALVICVADPEDPDPRMHLDVVFVGLVNDDREHVQAAPPVALRQVRARVHGIAVEDRLRVQEVDARPRVPAHQCAYVVLRARDTAPVHPDTPDFDRAGGPSLVSRVRACVEGNGGQGEKYRDAVNGTSKRSHRLPRGCLRSTPPRDARQPATI